LIEDDFVVDEHIPYESVDLGTPDYQASMAPSLAFSVGQVFQWGLALLQERPIMVILAGLNLFIVVMVPQFISMPVDRGLEIAAATGEVGEIEKQLISSLIALAVQLVAFPVQQLVVAGAYVGFAEFIRSDEAKISRLYTSVRPAVNALLYSLTVLAINLVVIVITWGPGIALGAYLLYQGNLLFGQLAIVAGILITLPVLIYVGLGLFLGIFAAVLDNRLPIEALRISWRLARGARLTLLVTQISLGFLGLLATCFCLFPSIIVNGMILAGYTTAWMHCSRAQEITEKWEFTERWRD
jgi:hypothetical protein